MLCYGLDSYNFSEGASSDEDYVPDGNASDSECDGAERSPTVTHRTDVHSPSSQSNSR
jgi:hypothetical protein